MIEQRDLSLIAFESQLANSEWTHCTLRVDLLAIEHVSKFVSITVSLPFICVCKRKREKQFAPACSWRCSDTSCCSDTFLQRGCAGVFACVFNCKLSLLACECHAASSKRSHVAVLNVFLTVGQLWNRINIGIAIQRVGEVGCATTARSFWLAAGLSNADFSSIALEEHLALCKWTHCARTGQARAVRHCWKLVDIAVATDGVFEVGFLTGALWWRWRAAGFHVHVPLTCLAHENHIACREGTHVAWCFHVLAFGRPNQLVCVWIAIQRERE
mmetsp:Transcript_52663/g.94533  ORF Transcript_52663/g.94533 Transcript_52663/m.94533 type:complete len:272 (+) Transcript_52663:264-1079(+)